MHRQARLTEFFDQIAEFTPVLEFGSEHTHTHMPPPNWNLGRSWHFGFWLSRTPPPPFKFRQILELWVLTFQNTPTPPHPTHLPPIALFLCAPGVVQYMLNDLLNNPEVYTDGYSICVFPSCVLENDGVSECYTIWYFDALQNWLSAQKLLIFYINWRIQGGARDMLG